MGTSGIKAIVETAFAPQKYRAFKSGKGDINGHKTTGVIFIKL